MKRRWLIPVLIVAVVAAGAYLAAGYMVFDRLATVRAPDAEDAENTPAGFKESFEDWADYDTAPYFMPDYETVSFPSRNSEVRISGWYIQGDPSAPAVIVTHGINASRREAHVLLPAGMLARNGFSVLLYDLRNHGDSESDGGRTSIGNKEYQDVLGAWDWLVNGKGFSPEQIGLYGVSLGAGATLIAFAEEPRVEATFVDSPYADLSQIMQEELEREGYPVFLATAAIWSARWTDGVDLLAHSPKRAMQEHAGRPIFAVHGTADGRINVHHTRDLTALSDETGADLTVWLPEGVDHVATVYALSEEYEQALTNFFEAALK